MNLVKIIPGSDAIFPLFVFGFRYNLPRRKVQTHLKTVFGLQVQVLSRPLQKRVVLIVRGVHALLAATSKHVKLAGAYSGIIL